MARVNVGIDPRFLSDQHLIAESVEITVITGGLRKNGYEIKSKIPDKLVMGTGYINFFKNKLVYLKRRLESVNEEMRRRGFEPGTKLELDNFPKELCNDWSPSIEDSMVLRLRIADRLITRANGESASKIHRYGRRHLRWYRKRLAEVMMKSELYFV